MAADHNRKRRTSIEASVLSSIYCSCNICSSKKIDKEKNLLNGSTKKCKECEK